MSDGGACCGATGGVCCCARKAPAHRHNMTTKQMNCENELGCRRKAIMAEPRDGFVPVCREHIRFGQVFYRFGARVPKFNRNMMLTERSPDHATRFMRFSRSW